jgi:phosphoribosylglycinamide formyltransferase 1
MNFAILASTNGTDLPAIFEGFRSGKIQGEIVCAITNNENCGALQKLKAEGVISYFRNHTGKNREEFDIEISEILKKHRVDYILCIGYMRIFSSNFVREWEKKIINVHPSLLPAFPGAHAIQDALDYGVKVSGATIHYIDTGVDTGPIIAQSSVNIQDDDNISTLKEKIQKAEQKLYVQVLSELTHLSLKQ